MMLPTVKRVHETWIWGIKDEDEVYLGNETVEYILERPDIQIYHLYIISNDAKIKAGNWFINTGSTQKKEKANT